MKKFILTTALTAIAFTAAPSFAVTQGTLGSSSTGDISLTMEILNTVGPQIQISGLRDIDLGSRIEGISGTLSTHMGDICVFADSASTYGIEITSGNNLVRDGIGLLSGNVTDDISYTWEYLDGDNNRLSGANTGSGFSVNTSAECSSGPTGIFAINVQDSSTIEIDSDTFFTDIITFTVSPE